MNEQNGEMDWDVIPNEVRPLLTEVAEVVRSDRFLAGCSQLPDISMKERLGRPQRAVVVPITDFLEAVDVKNEESAWTKWNDEVINETGKKYYGLKYCTTWEYNRYLEQVERFEGVLTDLTDRHPRVTRMVDFVYRGKKENVRDDLRHHFINETSRTVVAMIQTRVLTGGRHCLYTELAFRAFAAGLYPYGLNDDDNVVCINPTFILPT